MSIQDRVLQWIQQNVARGEHVNRVTCHNDLKLSYDQVKRACNRLAGKGHVTTSAGRMFRSNNSGDQTDYKAKCQVLITEKVELEQKVKELEAEVESIRASKTAQRKLMSEISKNMRNRVKAQAFDIIAGLWESAQTKKFLEGMFNEDTEEDDA